MIRTLATLAAIVALGTTTAFAQTPAAAPAKAASANPQVEFDTTAGKIRIELYPDVAPKTVANFLHYVKEGYYTGLMFHRVIDGFMIQAGGYGTDYKSKPLLRPPVANEAEASVKAGLSNQPGMIAMARTSEPHSASSQWFINVGNNKRLDFTSATPQGYGYTVFGKVVDGMDVVNKIAKVQTGAGGPFESDVPKTAIVITSAKIVDAK